MSAAFQTLALGDLRESKANPRQHFDQVTLAELAASIKAHGVITPILCRPVNGHFEIAAGHRRFRASKLAGVDTIPAVVREMSDDQLLEVLVTENLQREDVHPLEEAHGYKALMKAGYTVERIAERVGRSEKYVYDRMKLMQLGKKAQALFFAGTITAGHAILLSRISVADQDRAIEEDHGLLRPDNGLFDPTAPDRGEENDPVKPVSVRELDAWIARHVRFDPTKADPVLFTGAAAAQAEEPEKLIAITREAQLSDDTRSGGSKVLGPRSWRSASGLIDDAYDWGKVRQSKTCELSVRGVFVTGPGRGEVLPVCIAKKKCLVHYGAEIRARKKAEKARTAAPTGKAKAEPKEDRWAAEDRKRKAATAAWIAATPALFKAAAERVAGATVGQLHQLLAEELTFDHDRKDLVEAALPMASVTDAKRAIRHLALCLLAGHVGQEWNPKPFTDAAKSLGLDVAKILKDAAPAKVRACRKCGCTEANACEGGCSWAEKDLCSSCVQTSAKKKGKKARA